MDFGFGVNTFVGEFGFQIAIEPHIMWLGYAFGILVLVTKRIIK